MKIYELNIRVAYFIEPEEWCREVNIISFEFTKNLTNPEKSSLAYLKPTKINVLNDVNEAVA